jgi:hypothetical protein
VAHLIIKTASGNAVVVTRATKQRVERLLEDFVGIHRYVQSQSQEEGERKDVGGMAEEVESVLRELRNQ